MRSNRTLGCARFERCIEAGKFVASSLNLPATMRLSDEEHFPQAVRDKMEAWNWGTHTLVTLHLALSDKPDYAAAQFDADMNRVRTTFPTT